MTDTVQRDLRRLKISSVLLGMAFTILSIAVGFFVYWSFTGKDVLVIKKDIHGKEMAFPVESAVVQPGGKVAMKVNLCKVSSAEGRTIRRLVSNTSEVFVPTENDATGKRCYNNIPVSVPVPVQIACGTYHVNYRIVYRTNPLHTVTEEFNSESFKVCG